MEGQRGIIHENSFNRRDQRLYLSRNKCELQTSRVNCSQKDSIENVSLK